MQKTDVDAPTTTDINSKRCCRLSLDPKSTTPAAASAQCVPQKPLAVSSDHFLPQLRVSALQNRPSQWTKSLHSSTGGLGPRHPLIRDWNDRRERMTTQTTSHSFATQQQKHTNPSSSVSKSSAYTGSSGQDHVHDGVFSNQPTGSIVNEKHERSSLITNRKVSFPTEIHDMVPTLGLQTSKNSQLAGKAAAIASVKRTTIQKPTVHFEQHDGSQNPPSGTVSPSLRSATQPGVSLRPATTADHKPGRHSLSLTHPSTTTQAEKSSDSIFSTSLTDFQRVSNSLTSLPSLPLIRSNILSNRPSLFVTSTSSGSSLSFIHRALSEREEICSAREVQSGRGRNDCQCSVINLRIPFGKVEEWDVPHQEMSSRRNPVQVGSSRQLKDSGSVGDTTSTKAPLHKLEKLEFVVFSDLPKHPLPSTSSLLASLAPSPHHTTTNNSIHWSHIDPTFPQDHTHIDVVAGENSTTKDINNDSFSDDAKDSSSPSNVPDRASFGFEFTSQALPHTLRYRHLVSQQRSSLPACLLEPTTERDANPSMSITSYPRPLNHGSLRKKERLSNDGSHSPSDSKRVSPSSGGGGGLSQVSDGSNGNSPASLDLTQRSLRPSALGQGRPSGNGGYCSSRRPVKRKNLDNIGFDYPDPLSDCSSRYHHRLLRLAALVSETLTHEHSTRKHKR